MARLRLKPELGVEVEVEIGVVAVEVLPFAVAVIMDLVLPVRDASDVAR
jgi:hypothetical protein